MAVLASNYLLWQDASKAISKVLDDNNITTAYKAEYDRYPPDRFVMKVMQRAKEEARGK